MKSSDEAGVDLELLRSTGVQVRSDEQSLEVATFDAGGIASADPQALVSPADGAEVAAVLRLAAQQGWTVGVRGWGGSLGGQSLSGSPIVMDVGRLTDVERVDQNSIWVGAGADWFQVVHELRGEGLYPLPFPDDGTIGGAESVAAGGFGLSHAPVGGRALGFNVVTGGGEEVRCSEDENAELFDVVRGGLGQFGVITAARLRLCPLPSRVLRTFKMFPDLEALVEGLRQLRDSDAIHVEGRCVPALVGRGYVEGASIPIVQWCLVVETIGPPDRTLVEGGPDRLQRQNIALEEWLEPSPWLLPQPEMPGAGSGLHPWIDWTLPLKAAVPFIEGLLGGLPAELVVGGRLAVQVRRPEEIPLLVDPEGPEVVQVSLHCRVPTAAASGLLPLLGQLARLGEKAGGKRHPAGWLDFDADHWRRHFGDLWPRLCRAKRFYDPHGVLNPGVIPFD